jgi:outer membrane protein OmpA-like peptidoglycan-associated protein
MNYKSAIFILIASTFQFLAIGQTETYSIKKTLFCTDKYDEFAPAFYRNGLVFCTNRNLSLVNYSTSQNKGLIKINYIDTTGEVKWQNSRLFSKNLTTKLNDGPVTFNTNRDVIYYSRNLMANSSLNDLSSPRNKLGIYTAVRDGNEWTKIKDLRINNEYYNVTTPWLSPDGKKLFFASDKPGGYGGFDLYSSQLKDDYWEDPVNLGPNINTKGNEIYPFISPLGELFFSSDGQPGLGGKDIFFSRLSNGEWLAPIHLDAPVNSKYDDFGIITDSLMTKGFFSSNRDKSYDIYQFKTNFPQIFYSSIQKENQYCFRFSDSGSIEIDTLNLKYVWDFGDGKKASGMEVSHCYQGPGKYNVKLGVVERASENLFFSKLSYLLELKDIEQPYINSHNVTFKGDTLDFDGLKSFQPGYKILNYSWDFGDGTREQGEKVRHSFKEKGEYMVNLGLTLKAESSGKIHKTGSSKKILVLNDLKEISSYLEENSVSNPYLPDIRKYSLANIKTFYSGETEFKQDAVFQVELLASETKVDSNNVIFKKVPKKFTVEERFNSDAGIYSYIVDEQMNLMATYIAYREIEDAGYKDVHTKIEILTDPAAKELYTVKKIFGTSTDSYFDGFNRLTSSAYLLLDQVIKILNKYPGIRIEVDVHTDNTESPEAKLILSQNYAQTLTSYMINRGVSGKRLVAKGFGGSRPIAPNFLEKDRKSNRRIDFRIIKN